MVRVQEGREQEALTGLQQFYATYNPGFPFEFQFLDEEYRAQYLTERLVSTLSRYFAGLAVIISCLGLFGLAAFTTERRYKEIGIRKVLGSSEVGIIYLLSSDFTKMVLVSIAIAVPLSYLISKRWLDTFEFSVSLAWWFFIVAAIAALVVAWVTISLQTIRASKVNPVQCLKDN